MLPQLVCVANVTDSEYLAASEGSTSLTRKRRRRQAPPEQGSCVRLLEPCVFTGHKGDLGMPA